MDRSIRYRVVSRGTEAIVLLVTLPENLLSRVTDFFDMKERQIPSLPSHDVEKNMAAYALRCEQTACSVFDKEVLSADSPCSAISSSLAIIHEVIPNISYANLKTILRKAGRLKGTGL
ncbi:hypothetical protein F6V25_05195 [Oryzomonas japonica]|uniref:Uncharacterized protein n=1 Tax=Oryzomonas japonica TaxID=2603858 RepID=A0A7J4ZTR6_9BACT|nr:hypothetical protein [Oryzomonas japonica]KAB0666812.1 hypothetical protein F6V25_05195 [Oryzomonas japonica]